MQQIVKFIIGNDFDSWFFIKLVSVFCFLKLRKKKKKTKQKENIKRKIKEKKRLFRALIIVVVVDILLESFLGTVGTMALC